MSDTYRLMRALVESKPHAAKRSTWRPPSETQLDLEKSLTRAIKRFIMSAKLTHSSAIMPDEQAHDRLLDTIARCLEQAVVEGQGIANKGQERGIISAAKNIAGRAVQLVSDIVDTIKDKAKEILNKFFGGGDVDDPEAVLQEAQSELDAWAGEYSTGVAENEVQMAVNEAIVDEMQKQGVTMLDIVLDPEACDVCRDIVEESPTVSIEDGERLPPFHFRCKCGAVEHEE